MKGWFKVPGVRPDGDRSIEEQLLGLDKALAECKGKRVLDLGAAEGCISAAFARAGALEVVAIELVATHVEVGRKVCKGLPVHWVNAHLGEHIIANPQPDQFDIVLALGIIHKLEDPKVPLAWAARAAKDLLCFRAPAKKDKVSNADYLIYGKHSKTPCNVQQVMRDAKFADEGTVNGVRGEAVQYFRRKR